MPRQSVEFAVTAAERLNQSLNAFLEIDRDASQVQSEGVLAGMPVAVKDNICVKGDAGFVRLPNTRRLSSTLQRNCD